MSAEKERINLSLFLNGAVGLFCISVIITIFSLNASILRIEMLGRANQDLVQSWLRMEIAPMEGTWDDELRAGCSASEYLEIIDSDLPFFLFNPLGRDHESGGEGKGLSPYAVKLKELTDGIMSAGFADYGAAREAVIAKLKSREAALLGDYESLSRDLTRRKAHLRKVRNYFIALIFLTVICYSFYHYYRIRRTNELIENLSRFMRENPDPVMRISYSMTITIANSASLSLLRKWQSAIGNKIPDHIAATARQAIEEKSIKYIEEDVGEKIYRIALVYIYDKDYLNLYAGNITDLRRLQNEMQHKQRMESLGLLAGGIAHDFNNLLTSIMNAAQLIILEDPENQDNIVDYSNMILEASDHAADLTRKLLDFSRVESPVMKILDLGEILESTITILKRSVNKKISLQFTNESWNPYVKGDRGGLQRIFLNMGINANQAMPDGGTLTYRLQNIHLNEQYCALCPHDLHPGEYCKIEIEDSGVGIPRDKLHRIFDPFFTTKEFGKGAGLGLSSSFGIIEHHGGAIHVYSEEYVGTIFHIYIPCVRNGISNVGEDKLQTGSGRILLVDDEYLVRITTESLLTNLGYKVTPAGDGLEALEIIRENKNYFDLVIMDMTMTGMNGRETAAEIKAIRRDLPILLSSGFSKDSNEEILHDVNLSGFLKKPFRDIEISRIVHELIGSG